MIEPDQPTEPAKPKKQPKIISYMAALYAAMSEQANEIKAEDGESVLIWQGRLIQTCTSVGIPEGYYKKVVDALGTIGSIEIHSRGRRGSALTVISLRHPPTAEAYDEAIVKSGWQGLTRHLSLDTLGAEVKDVQRTIGGLDIRSMFKNHEDRVAKLETAVAVLKDQVDQLSNNKQ